MTISSHLSAAPVCRNRVLPSSRCPRRRTLGEQPYRLPMSDLNLHAPQPDGSIEGAGLIKDEIGRVARWPRVGRAQGIA